MNWIKTTDELPRLYAKVLTSNMAESRLTPDGWEGEIPEEWAYVREPIRSEDQQSISDWGTHTFGQVKDPAVLVGRALEEFGELVLLLMETRAGRKFQEVLASVQARLRTPEYRDESLIADELADILVVLYQAAEGYGVDLLGAVDNKMKTNRSRKWKITQSGVGQHE